MKDVVCCVPVMTKEKRVGKKMVCEPITETKEIEVCVPHTTCETRCVSTCGGCCGTVSCPTTVWDSLFYIPVILFVRWLIECFSLLFLRRNKLLTPENHQQTYTTEKKTITCTRMESKCVDYEYEVSVCKMEQQTKQIKVRNEWMVHQALHFCIFLLLTQSNKKQMLHAVIPKSYLSHLYLNPEGMPLGDGMRWKAIRSVCLQDGEGQEDHQSGRVYHRVWRLPQHLLLNTQPNATYCSPLFMQ